MGRVYNWTSFKRMDTYKGFKTNNVDVIESNELDVFLGLNSPLGTPGNPPGKASGSTPGHIKTGQQQKYNINPHRDSSTRRNNKKQPAL